MKKIVTMVIQAVVDDNLSNTETIKGLSEQIAYNLEDCRPRLIHAKIQDKNKPKMIDLEVD